MSPRVYPRFTRAWKSHEPVPLAHHLDDRLVVLGDPGASRALRWPDVENRTAPPHGAVPEVRVEGDQDELQQQRVGDHLGIARTGQASIPNPNPDLLT